MWLLFSLLVITFLGECTNERSAEEIATVSESLPDIFSPLSWEMQLKELNSLFPSADLQETRYTGLNSEEMIVSMVFGITWDYFGEAYVHIAHHKYKRIDIVSISTTETRLQCFEDLPRPNWCRSNYSDELVTILGGVKEIISKAYGPPLEYKGGYRAAAGLPPDPRETSFKWEREGYNLFLSISVGEQDDWEVKLQAVRHPVQESG